LQTEKEDQVGRTGQDRDAQQHALDSQYYDDGPSIMPASESFAGNQDNWGASATDNWSGANAGTGGAETSDWNAPAAPTTGSAGWSFT
jgi:hypothetical protein